MNIALIAHDSKKELMVQFCIAYCRVLSQHNLVATGTTGKLVGEATGLSIQRFLPGTHGGDLATLTEADLARLDNPRELAIASQLAQFREVIENSARELAPHLIAFYLKDLAGEFHAWYNAERMLVDDAALRDARVALAASVRQVIRNGLAILGVSCPESM